MGPGLSIPPFAEPLLAEWVLGAALFLLSTLLGVVAGQVTPEYDLEYRRLGLLTGTVTATFLAVATALALTGALWPLVLLNLLGTATVACVAAMCILVGSSLMPAVTISFNVRLRLRERIAYLLLPEDARQRR